MNRKVKIPRILIEHDYYKNLSDRARVLYGILSEKEQEAEKHGWVDEQGCLYVVFPKRRMQEELACSRYRVDLVTKELVITDLIGLDYGIGSSLERRIYVHKLKEECPWIRVEYGGRKKTPDEGGGPAAGAATKESNTNTKEKEKKEGHADDTGSRALGTEGHDPGPGDIDPMDILKGLMEAGRNDPDQAETGWQKMLEALCSFFD